jgi:hypothetical protein
MRLTGYVNSTVRMLRFTGAVMVWLSVTLWLGTKGVWRAVWFLAHVRQAFSRTLRCPRGHAVDAYAPLRCGRCHAAFEGHVFDPCPACGASARFIACPKCGLSLRNDLT